MGPWAEALVVGGWSLGLIPLHAVPVRVPARVRARARGRMRGARGARPLGRSRPEQPGAGVGASVRPGQAGPGASSAPGTAAGPSGQAAPGEPGSGAGPR